MRITLSELGENLLRRPVLGRLYYLCIKTHLNASDHYSVFVEIITLAGRDLTAVLVFIVTAVCSFSIVWATINYYDFFLFVAFHLWPQLNGDREGRTRMLNQFIVGFGLFIRFVDSQQINDNV